MRGRDHERFREPDWAADGDARRLHGPYAADYYLRRGYREGLFAARVERRLSLHVVEQIVRDVDAGAAAAATGRAP